MLRRRHLLWRKEGNVLRAGPPLWDERARRLSQAMAEKGVTFSSDRPARPSRPRDKRAPATAPQWVKVIEAAEAGKTMQQICAELEIQRIAVLRALARDRGNRPDLACRLRETAQHD